MADLLTLPEYKSFTGIDVTDDRDDTRITSLLPAVSRVIRSYTGRSLEVVTGAAITRTFQYDGSGFLDIDDCTNVTAVATDASVPGQTYELLQDEWTAMPHSSEVIYYIIVHGGPLGGISREMGFERNLDTMEFIPGRRPVMNVTAIWGWPAIPEDVKVATAWTLQEWLSKTSGENLTAEAIEGYSRAWGGRGGALTALAIPNRARDILAAYQRQEI